MSEEEAPPLLLLLLMRRFVPYTPPLVGCVKFCFSFRFLSAIFITARPSRSQVRSGQVGVTRSDVCGWKGKEGKGREGTLRTHVRSNDNHEHTLSLPLPIPLPQPPSLKP